MNSRAFQMLLCISLCLSLNAVASITSLRRGLALPRLHEQAIKRA